MKYAHFTYPFSFNEQLLTRSTLDLLGFSNYLASCNGFGTRVLTLDGKRYEVTVIDEQVSPTSGYAMKEYAPEIIASKYKTILYFLHDLYDDVFENLGVDAANELQTICDTVGMGVCMQLYVEFREQYIDEAYYNEFMKDKI